MKFTRIEPGNNQRPAFASTKQNHALPSSHPIGTKIHARPIPQPTAVCGAGVACDRHRVAVAITLLAALSICMQIRWRCTVGGRGLCRVRISFPPYFDIATVLAGIRFCVGGGVFTALPCSMGRCNTLHVARSLGARVNLQLAGPGGVCRGYHVVSDVGVSRLQVGDRKIHCAGLTHPKHVVPPA